MDFVYVSENGVYVYNKTMDSEGFSSVLWCRGDFDEELCKKSLASA